jgi:hypothetical protein
MRHKHGRILSRKNRIIVEGRSKDYRRRGRHYRNALCGCNVYDDVKLSGSLSEPRANLLIESTSTFKTCANFKDVGRRKGKYKIVCT